MTKLIVALAFLGFNFYIYQYLATEEVIPVRQRFERFPDEIGSWICDERGRIDPKVLANLGATDYLICDYYREEPDAWINVYVGYHETQVRREGGGGGENSIHPPEHCLPGAGWDVIDARIVDLGQPGLPVAPGARKEAKRFLIAKGDRRRLVYFWYQSRGRAIARNRDVIFYRFWDRATRRRTDGSLVRLTVPVLHQDEAGAEATLLEFATQFAPLLPPYTPS